MNSKSQLFKPVFLWIAIAASPTPAWALDPPDRTYAIVQTSIGPRNGLGSTAQVEVVELNPSRGAARLVRTEWFDRTLRQTALIGRPDSAKAPVLVGLTARSSEIKFLDLSLGGFVSTYVHHCPIQAIAEDGPMRALALAADGEIFGIDGQGRRFAYAPAFLIGSYGGNPLAIQRVSLDRVVVLTDAHLIVVEIGDKGPSVAHLWNLRSWAITWPEQLVADSEVAWISMRDPNGHSVAVQVDFTSGKRLGVAGPGPVSGYLRLLDVKDLPDGTRHALIADLDGNYSRTDGRLALARGTLSLDADAIIRMGVPVSPRGLVLLDHERSVLTHLRRGSGIAAPPVVAVARPPRGAWGPEELETKEDFLNAFREVLKGQTAGVTASRLASAVNGNEKLKLYFRMRELTDAEIEELRASHLALASFWVQAVGGQEHAPVSLESVASVLARARAREIGRASCRGALTAEF